mmetsp:Transcript_41663/g.105050  ORF Transcript_41663/g.105050 Transcript_41663/m.105050 type:complete len:383 (-) Transcript_41663:2101-3249(-)
MLQSGPQPSGQLFNGCVARQDQLPEARVGGRQRGGQCCGHHHTNGGIAGQTHLGTDKHQQGLQFGLRERTQHLAEPLWQRVASVLEHRLTQDLIDGDVLPTTEHDAQRLRTECEQLIQALVGLCHLTNTLRDGPVLRNTVLNQRVELRQTSPLAAVGGRQLHVGTTLLVATQAFKVVEQIHCKLRCLNAHTGSGLARIDFIQIHETEKIVESLLQGECGLLLIRCVLVKRSVGVQKLDQQLEEGQREHRRQQSAQQKRTAQHNAHATIAIAQLGTHRGSEWRRQQHRFRFGFVLKLTTYLYQNLTLSRRGRAGRRGSRHLFSSRCVTETSKEQREHLARESARIHTSLIGKDHLNRSSQIIRIHQSSETVQHIRDERLTTDC